MKNGLPLQLRAAAIVLLSVLMLVIVGCVNRGQRPPDGGSGLGGMGTGGQDASSVDVVDGRGPDGAGGGSVACVASDAGADAGADADAGAGAGVDGGDAMTCSSFMSFEGCVTYGAQLQPPSSQLAFTSVSAISSPTACGSGALAIDANLTFSDADSIHFGELYLTIPGGPIDLGGKTLTFHAAASVPGTILTSLYLIPMSSIFEYGPSVKVSPLKTTWTTASVDIVPGVIVRDSVRFSIQLRGPGEYAGRIYIDEIEITNTPPPDGGADAGDGGGDAGDVRPTDVRDGSAGDATDARDGPG